MNGRRRLLELALASATLATVRRAGAASSDHGPVPGKDGLPGAGAAPEGAAAPAAPRSSRWLSGARFGDDDFRAVTLDADGRPGAVLPLPSRAHGAAVHVGRGVGCLFARRPGTWLCTFDIARLREARFVEAEPARPLSGHGVYSRDGSLLYTCENDTDAQRGVLAVRETASDYRRVAEIGTHGIGPHEIVRPPGTDLLVVANGGIATHPDHGDGREPLNLETMAPSIVVLDARDGRLVSRHALPERWRRVSLRHLAVDGANRVWFAAQRARPTDDLTLLDPRAAPLPLAGSFPLAGRHGRLPSGDRVHAPEVLELPREQVPQRHAYLSSVAADARHVLYTSAREGLAFRVDARERRLDGVLMLPDCSGVAPAPDGGGFVLSTGLGETWRWHGETPTLLARSRCDWDNHLAATVA